MKIGEILELTQHKRISEIAKENLDVGEKKAVEALKKAGCYSIGGKRGWYFDGDKEVLEHSIYDYVAYSQRKGTIKPKVVINPTSQLPTNTETIQDGNTKKKQENKQSNNPINKPMKKVTYEIEEQLHDELKIKSIREKRNVSEIVNEIIKKALN